MKPIINGPGCVEIENEHEEYVEALLEVIADALNEIIIYAAIAAGALVVIAVKLLTIGPLVNGG